MRSRTVVAFLMAAALSASCASNDAGTEPEDGGNSAISGTWDLARVEAQLRARHLEPVRASESVRQPFMSVAGTRLQLGNSEMQVYVYADHNSRAQDTGVLNVHHVTPPHTMISWRLPPTLIVVDNVAVILLTDEPALRDHVRAALAAGH